MRFAFTFALVLAAACTRADRPHDTADTPRTGADAPRTGAEAPRTGATVAPAPLVFAPLAWSLAEDDAFARLEAAHMAPRRDEQRAYFSTPEQFHAAPGTIEVAHTIEPMLLFTPRPGWTGTAHYPSPGGALDTIELRAQLADATAAHAELAALERRLGPPDDRRTFPDDAGAPGARRLIWVRGGVWLVAFASPDGAVSLAYRRDARPASDIGP